MRTRRKSRTVIARKVIAALRSVVVAVSATFAAVAAAFWARSYRLMDSAAVPGDRAWVLAKSAGGMIEVVYGTYKETFLSDTGARLTRPFVAPPFQQRESFQWDLWAASRRPDDYSWRAAFIAYHWRDMSARGGARREIYIPHAFLFIALSGPPVLWIFGLRRRSRREWAAGGKCAQCGYDLRASPMFPGPLLSRCPECGRDR